LSADGEEARLANVSLSSAAISAGIGSVVAFLGAAGKSYLDSRRSIDVDLRAKRIEVYQELWKNTGLFRLWPRTLTSYADARVFQDDVSNWYFERGGLFMSRRSQQAYRRLQSALTTALENRSASIKETDPMPPEDWSGVRDGCSNLRTALTGDLLSRRSGRRIL
jgi:hypothetical protein